MTAIATNPMAFNDWVTQIGLLVPVTTTIVDEVNTFTDTDLNTAIPQILNYAELRIQRDLSMLPAETSNTYTLTAGNYIFPLPVDDFVIVNRIVLEQLNGTQVITTTPLLEVSQEFIQNVYGGLATPGTPQYFAMVGDSWGNGGTVNNNISFGPTPNFAYTIRVHGLIRTPSLYTYSGGNAASTKYTYISTYYPDMLILASMIYIAGAYQKNMSATSDSQDAPLNYEKQYQILRVGAIAEENRKKSQGSGWSAYPTPVSATPTR
jgi:hypothetical protein